MFEHKAVCSAARIPAVAAQWRAGAGRPRPGRRLCTPLPATCARRALSSEACSLLRVGLFAALLSFFSFLSYSVYVLSLCSAALEPPRSSGFSNSGATP